MSPSLENRGINIVLPAPDNKLCRALQRVAESWNNEHN